MEATQVSTDGRMGTQKQEILTRTVNVDESWGHYTQ